MAGYIMTLNSNEAMKNCIYNGVYGTILKEPTNYWRQQHEGTFADYATMKPGDNIYFFLERKIYGIGELISINNNDCKFLNYPNSNKPINYDYDALKNELLFDESEESVNQRWLCIFKPSPYFFEKGVDMDEVLAYKPSSFRSLRAFWKLSFIKLDDEENQSLKDVLLKNNQFNLKAGNQIFDSNYNYSHELISRKLNQGDYRLKPSDLLTYCMNETRLKHEMALELAILYQLSNSEPETINLFGKWDYLSHQVVASPFKPIDYMDKMDIFGYKFIPGFNPTKSKFLVMELKKDEAKVEDVDQLLKYVDWVKDEYAYGDYSMIDAYLVAFDFSREVIDCAKENGIRKYTIGKRPVLSKEWSNINLIIYDFDETKMAVKFRKIATEL
jgi:hypothetical protein